MWCIKLIIFATIAAPFGVAVKIVRHSINHTMVSSVAGATTATTSSGSDVSSSWRPISVHKSGAATPRSIILDCDYIYDPGDVKLVVRWFFDDSSEPIYQWIPSSDNRYIGQSIRPFFDMQYRVSDDRFTKYRAIRLRAPQSSRTTKFDGNERNHNNNNNKDSENDDDNNHSDDDDGDGDGEHHHLPISLSGKYTCVISSIMNQDSRNGHVMIYVPPQKFEFNLLTQNVTSIGDSTGDSSAASGDPSIRCLVEDTWPKPLLTFSQLTSTAMATPSATSVLSSQHSKLARMAALSGVNLDTSFSAINVRYSLNHSSSLYTAWFEYPLPVASIRVGTIYECKLDLPATNFVRKKRIKLIYPSTYEYARDSSGGAGDKRNFAHQSQQQADHRTNEDHSRSWHWPSGGAHDHRLHHRTSLSSQPQHNKVNFISSSTTTAKQCQSSIVVALSSCWCLQFLYISFF